MAVGKAGAAGRVRLHYAWIVMAVAFVALLVSAGFRSAPSVLIVPLEQEFGWSRASVSLAVGVQLLIYGLVGPFSAGLVDRFGLRKTLLGALALSSFSFGSTLLVGSVWNLWLIWGLGSGIGTGCAAMVLASIIANRWFVARRGLAMGILAGSSAAGQLVFLPLLANLTVALGWRSAVVIGTCLGAAVIPLVYFLMRDRPAEMGLKPYGVSASVPDEPLPPRANPFTSAFTTLGSVIGMRDFWLLSLSFLVCGATTFGLISTHFIPACLDHGIPEATAAGMMAAMGVCNIIGTTASGWLCDRVDSRYLLFWYYGLRGLALLFLPYAFDLPVWGLIVFGLFYGFDWVTTVPPTVRLTVNVFGMQRSGVVYGWIMVMHQLGAAIFAYGSGVVRTELGDYFAAYIVSGILCFIAALLVLRIGGASRARTRPALVAAEA